MDTDRAIVFVHGLEGHPCESFKSENTSWPEIIANDSRANSSLQLPPLSDYALYTVDYRKVFEGSSTVDEAASQILAVLLNTPTSNGETILQRYNHVWFIAHSLGGIVVKRILLQLAENNRIVALSRITGVFLLGVPSKGAPLANFSDTTLAKILRMVIGKNYSVVRDLAPQSAASFLDSTERSWENFVNNYQNFFVFCAYERSPDVPGTEAYLVPKLFSFTRCTTPAQPVSAKHTDLAKPTEQGDEIHIWLRGKLMDSSSRMKEWKRQIIDEPIGEPLASILDRDKRPETETGVTQYPEVIQYDSEKSASSAKKLGIQSIQYTGATFADVIESIALHNNCIKAKISKSRRVIELHIGDETQQCKKRGAAVGKVCSLTKC